VAGESRGLSGPADRLVFHHLRGLADVVMVAAGTVRADRYGPARPTQETRARRRARGQAEVPAICVVSRSLDLDWDSPLFQAAATPTIVVCPEDADPSRRAMADARCRLVAAGWGAADLGAAMATLHAEGVRLVLCEGGPGLIGQLAGSGLLDELFLTVSPLLVSGTAPRVLTGPGLDPPLPLRLEAAAESDGFLFLRYLTAAA
jgi:riboflavin biosynthesis pyrimidine reductase